MPTDDLDVDAIVRECHTQAQLAGMVDNPGNMFRSVIKLAEEVKRLRGELSRFHECNSGRWTNPNEFGCDMTRGDDGARHAHKVYRKVGE